MRRQTSHLATVFAAPSILKDEVRVRSSHYLSLPGTRTRCFLVAVLLLACTPESLPTPETADDNFAGSEICRDCHPSAFTAWEGSHHERALAPATGANILGNFESVEFDDGTRRARFTRDGEDFYVEVPGPDGASNRLEVAYVIGVDPLQQLLVERPEGQLQAFPIAWDTRAGRWFALHDAGTEAGDAAPGDWLHWTGSAFNANSMCIECHATNVDVGYRPSSRNYQTTWSEGTVSCEACHGPRARHAADPSHSPSNPTAHAEAAPEDRDRIAQRAELEACGPCHSRRRRIHAAPAPGDSFHDRYATELVHEGLYAADGQIVDEVYVLGSFLQSRMYAEGVRCTHCHDPHTLQLVAEGNDLCSKCHDARYDSRSHHHHEEGSPGSQCVECHMRARTYMQIDPRRDHGFHLPRPDQSVAFGVPNACNACHADRDATWARDHVIARYGPQRPHDIHATAAFAADRSGKADADRLLGAAYDDPATPPILRATALARLAARGRSPLGSRIAMGLASADPMLRASAAAATEGLPPAERFELLAPQISDPSRSVRTEIGRILGPHALHDREMPRADSNPALLAAWNEYLEVQRSLGNQPGAEMNLAIANTQAGRTDTAEDHYLRALELDADFLPARFNLALLYDRQGRSQQAESQLRAALDTNPELGEAHYSLGLLLARDSARREDTANALAEAARKLPDRPRVQYNAGLAHQRLGRAGAAKVFLEEALRLEPGEADFRIALAILAAQQAQWNEARFHAQQFSLEHPDDARGPALRRQLHRSEP